MKPWIEVESDPAFQSLSDVEKSRAQGQYFDEVVAPQVPEEERPTARGQFFADFSRTDIPQDTGQGMGESAFNEAMRNLARVGTGTVEGLGQFGSSYVRNLNPVGWAAHLGVPGAKSLVDTYASIPESIAGAGEAAQQAVEETLPVNPLLQDTAPVKLAGVTGQVGGQLATILSGAAFTKVPTILQGIGLGQAGLLGMESGYEEADRLGVTGWERDAMGLAYGAAEAGVESMGGFGSSGFMKTLLGQNRDLLTGNVLKTLGKTALVEGVEEPITGILQAGASNALTEEDPNRPGFALNGQPLPEINPATGEFWKNRAEEFALGAYGGALFGGANVALSRPRAEQVQQQRQRTGLTILGMRMKPDRTEEENTELAELERQYDELGALVGAGPTDPPVADPAVEAQQDVSQTVAAMQETEPEVEETVEEISTEIPPVETPELVAEPSATEVTPPVEAAPAAEVAAPPIREIDLAEFTPEEFLAEGSESTVYRRGDRVFKVGEAYNDPTSFEPRVASILQGDREIGAGNLRLEGYYTSPNGVRNPVFSQPFIEGRAATEPEIQTHMESRGYVRVPSRRMYVKQTPEGILAASDLDGDNVKVMPNGQIEVIDATVFPTQATPEIEAALAATPAVKESLTAQTEETVPPAPAAEQDAWESSPEFAQAEELAAQGDLEAAEALEEAFRARQGQVIPTAEVAPEAVSEPAAAPTDKLAEVDPHLLSLGRSPTTSENVLTTELRAYSDEERTALQTSLGAADNKPRTLAKALKALQPKTGGRGGLGYGSQTGGSRRDAMDDVLDREEGEGVVRSRRRSSSQRPLPIKATSEDAQQAVEALRDILPSVQNAWIGTRSELLADDEIRRQFIALERQNDPSMSEEEASDRYDEMMGSPLSEGFTMNGRTYVITDGVGVTEADKSGAGAIRRVLIHEDAHQAIDSAVSQDPALAQEWESLKSSITPEDLDDLARRRYPMLKNWRNDAKMLNDLAHEYFAEQSETLERGGQVADPSLIERFLELIRKVLARLTGEQASDISEQRIMDFIRAGRQARERLFREAGQSTVRQSQQSIFGEMDVPPMPEMEPAFTDWIPIVDKNRAMELAWRPFAVAWQENNPQGTTAELNAAWAEEIANPESPAIAQGQTEAFMEARRNPDGPAVYSPESSQSAPEVSDPVSADYIEGTISEPRFSMQPSYSSSSEERNAEYAEAIQNAPDNGREYVEFLASPTKTPRISQAVRPMVDFARAQMGSYQGDEVEVNDDNTERVKELAVQAFSQNRDAGAAFAKEWSQKFRDSGFSSNGRHEGSLATGVLQMEILDYAVRLAGQTNDTSLALALMPYANDVAAADHASVSNSARALQLRSMAGQQKGFWTILSNLAKGQKELVGSNPVYKELREALFSNEVQDEVSQGLDQDLAGEEAQKVLNTVEPEDVMNTMMGRALEAVGEMERDLAIRFFTEMAELNLLLEKQAAMQAPPSSVKASMQAAREMNDPAAIQQRIDQLRGSISQTLKALDQFKTSSADKKTRQKAIDKTPRAKKAISADAQAQKMLERLANKPKRVKKEAPPWKAAFESQVKSPKSEADFATEMASAGLSPQVVTKLYEEAKKLTREAQDKKDESARRKSDRKETQQAVSQAKERVREQKREMDRPSRIADQKSFINSLVGQIFGGTIEQQNNPGWRRQIMVEAFKKEGFSQGSAENAADYLGNKLDSHLKAAQEKAARKAAQDLDMKKPTLEKLVRAIRSRAVDPLNADPVTKALAEEAGFAGITPEQFTELAKLDGELKGPYQSQRAKAAARMLDIALAAKPPKKRAEILTQAWISSALSSISTMSLSAVHAGFIPVRRLAFDFAGVAADVAAGKLKAAEAAQVMVNMLGNLQHSASYMLATAKFAGLNDAYTQHIVEFINQMHSMQADLQRAAATLRNPGATGVEKGKAAIKLAFTSTDIVRRILSTADETWGTMIQDFVLRNEAMRQLMQKGGLTSTEAAMLFASASNQGRAAGEKHRNETGNALEATMVERDATQNALLAAVKEVAGEQAAADVSQTAAKEGPMELGNRRSEDAPLWDIVNTPMEWVKQLAIVTRRKNELAGRMITGFVTVPANILNRSAAFTPLGIVRALYKMGKLGGNKQKIAKAYEETMGTEGQQRMRLIEGITGTILILALMALTAGDDEEGVVVTGSGPEDRGLREAWMKKGHAPNRLEWVDKNGNVRFSVAYARGGFDHLNLPFTLVGTLDDMRLKGIKPKPANVEWGTQYAHTVLKGLFDQAKFFGLKNVASMPTQMTDRSLASQAAYLAAPIVPWSGFTKSLGRLWTGPTDQSSVKSATLAQLPFTSFLSRPALNALGDQRGPAPTDAMWDRSVMTGVPFMVSAQNKGPDQDLYSLMIQRGLAPNVPLRSMIERRNGFLEDKVWEQYLQTRGGLIKKGMRQNLRRLKLLPHKDAQNLLERISSNATRAAKEKLKLE